jgi:hypothetical protein
MYYFLVKPVLRSKKLTWELSVCTTFCPYVEAVACRRIFLKEYAWRLSYTKRTTHRIVNIAFG